MGLRLNLLHDSNVAVEFLTFVIVIPHFIWFNTNSFLKTEVGSGCSGAPCSIFGEL